MRSLQLAVCLTCAANAIWAQEQTIVADPVASFDLSSVAPNALITITDVTEGITLGVSVLESDEESRLHRKLLLDGTSPVRFLADPASAASARATAIPGGPATAVMTVAPTAEPVEGPPGHLDPLAFGNKIVLAGVGGTQCVTSEAMGMPPYGLSLSTHPGDPISLALYDQSGARVFNQLAYTQLDLGHVDTAIGRACISSAAAPVMLQVGPADLNIAPEPDVTGARPDGITLSALEARTMLLGPRDVDQFVVPAGSMEQPYDVHFEASSPFTICKGTATRGEICRSATDGVTGPFPIDEDVILTFSKTGEWEKPITVTVTPTDVGGNSLAWALHPDVTKDAWPAAPFRVTGRVDDNESRSIIFDAGELPQMWRFAISGGQIRQVSLSSADDDILLRRYTPAENQRVVLQDVLLQPGQHTLWVTGAGSAAFRAIGRPLGPAPLDDEREPNDSRPALIDFDEPVRGRMPSYDIDSFQYFVRRDVEIEISTALPPGLEASLTSSLGSQASHQNLDRLRLSGTQSFRAPVQPGSHFLQFRSQRGGSPEDYRFTLQIVNPFEDAVAGLPDTTLGETTVAAHLLYGQRAALAGIPPEATSVQIWSAHPGVTLDQTSPTPTLAFAPDMPVGTFQGFALFEDADGQAVGGGQFVVVSDLFAAPASPVPAAQLPEHIQGAVNVALTSLGARLVATDEYDLDPETGDIASGHPSRASAILRAIDGVVAQTQPPVSHQATLGYRGYADPAISPVIDLPGDSPIPLVGFGISAIDNFEGGLRDFAVDVSQDGENWNEVISDNHANRDWTAVYPLDGPASARFVRLRPIADAQTKRTGVWINSFEAYADPAWSPEDVNLADPVNGALAHRDTDGSAFADSRYMLLPSSDTGRLLRPDPPVDVAPLNINWTFNRTRTALLDRIELDLPSEPTFPLPTRIVLEASLTDQRGPWREIATLPVENGQMNVVAQFDTPQAVRLLRMKLGFPEGENSISVPVHLRAIEAPPTKEHPSILGLPAAWDVPGVDRSLPVDADPNRGALAADAVSLTGTVNLGERVERWTLSGRAGANTAEVSVTGGPGFVPRLLALQQNGTERTPRDLRVDSLTSALIYVFDLAPDETLTLEVSEPQRSTVFLIDTSPSVAPFVPQIRRGIRRFADTMVAGEDAVQFAVIGREDLDDDWLTDPLKLQSRLNAPLSAGNSNAEGALVEAATVLRDREGSRAIVLVTDADSNIVAGTLEQLAAAQARVFAIKMSSGGMWQDPSISQPLSMVWAGLTGGEVWPVLAPEIDIAAGYARATARLLGPKNYSISATVSQIDVAPGGLMVEELPRGEEDADGATGRVLHILLDTSGSMLARQDDGTRRITLAKRALQDLIATPDLADSFGLRVFGGPPEQCLTTLVEAPQGYDPDQFSASLDGVAPQNLAKTPIAAALRAAREDLSGIADRAALVLITDGEETCDGDPLAEIEALRDAGIETRIDVVSFALADDIDRAPFDAWATAGGGTYYDVQDGGALTDVLQAVAQPIVSVWKDGTEIARLAVGETLIDLAPGRYEIRFEDGRSEVVDVMPETLTILGADGTRTEDM